MSNVIAEGTAPESITIMVAMDAVEMSREDFTCRVDLFDVHLANK